MVQPIQHGQSLLDDLVGARGEGLHIWWLGHTSFVLKHRGRFLGLDLRLPAPLEDDGRSYPRLLEPEQLDMVTGAACSQFEPEQFDAETILALTRATAGDLRLVIPYGIRDEAASALALGAPEFLYADEKLSVNLDGFNLAGVATSPGGEILRDGLGRCTALGYVISVGGFRIFHCSETTWHLGLTETLKALGSYDVMLLPIGPPAVGEVKPPLLSGSDAASLAKACGCGIAVPTHFDLIDEHLASTAGFRETCERVGQDHEVLDPGERLTIEREKP